MELYQRRAALLTGATCLSLLGSILVSRPASAQAPARPPIALPGAPFQPGSAPFQPSAAPFQGSIRPASPPSGPTQNFLPMPGAPFGSIYGAPSFNPGGYGMNRGGYGMFSSPYDQGWRRNDRRWNNIVRPGGGIPPNRIHFPESPTPFIPQGGSVSTLTPSAPPRDGFSGDGGFDDASQGPNLTGGFYFGGYTNTWEDYGTFPTVYSVYDGFPSYLYDSGPGIVTYNPVAEPVYYSAPQPFTPPVYQVTFNQNNYYVRTPSHAARIHADLSQGTAKARAAVKTAYPADSFQAAFADIERAWNAGDVGLLKNHLSADGSKIRVSLNGSYKYSLNPSDFTKITHDAFDHLDTVSFKFTELQKAKNGDLTAYGTHVYRLSDNTGNGAVVPFDADSAPTGASGTAGEKTVYVSYTLRHGDNGWYITAIDSSLKPLVKPAQ